MEIKKSQITVFKPGEYVFGDYEIIIGDDIRHTQISEYLEYTENEDYRGRVKGQETMLYSCEFINLKNTDGVEIPAFSQYSIVPIKLSTTTEVKKVYYMDMSRRHFASVDNDASVVFYDEHGNKFLEFYPRFCYNGENPDPGLLAPAFSDLVRDEIEKSRSLEQFEEHPSFDDIISKYQHKIISLQDEVKKLVVDRAAQRSHSHGLSLLEKELKEERDKSTFWEKKYNDLSIAVQAANLLTPPPF